MSLLDAVALIVVAGCCALPARALRGFTLGGWVRALPVALVGTVQGFVLARLLALPDLLDLAVDGRRFPVAWTALGACVLLAAGARLAARGRGARRAAGVPRAG